MSHQVDLNGSCQEMTDTYPQPPAEYSSDCGMLEVGEGPPAPPWLQDIVSSILTKNRQCTKSLKEDVFVALLFVLVHEVGFTVRGFDLINPSSSFNVRVLRSLKNLYHVDKVEFSYQIPLVLYDCDASCELVVVPVFNSNVFIVNFHSPDVETLSISYDVDNYVIISSDRSLKFKNLHPLAKSFKDVCHKFRNAVLDHLNLPSLHITKMPYEILLKISSFLDPHSFIYFSTCCKHLSETLNQDEFIWKKMYNVYFDSGSAPSPCSTWRKHFADETMNTQMSSRRRQRCEVTSFFPHVTQHIYFMRLPRI